MNDPDLIITLENGKILEVYRTEKKDVVIDGDGHHVRLPRASGRLTLDIIGLIDSGGKITEVE